MFRSGFPAQVPRSTEGTSGAGTLVPAAVAGVLWMAVALIHGDWLLHVLGRGQLKVVNAVAREPVQVDVTSLARALGAAEKKGKNAPSAPDAVQFRLLGFVSQPNRRGAALIAVDDLPPRPVVVGDTVQGSVRLLSVGPKSVRLGAAVDDPAAVELTLAPNRQ